MKEYRNTYFEIRDPSDNYGFDGHYETLEDALNRINNSHRHHTFERETWKIVCVERIKTVDDNGDFLKSEVTRFVYDTVEYSHYEDAFVIAY